MAGDDGPFDVGPFEYGGFGRSAFGGPADPFTYAGPKYGCWAKIFIIFCGYLVQVVLDHVLAVVLVVGHQLDLQSVPNPFPILGSRQQSPSRLDFYATFVETAHNPGAFLFFGYFLEIIGNLQFSHFSSSQLFVFQTRIFLTFLQLPCNHRKKQYFL